MWKKALAVYWGRHAGRLLTVDYKIGNAGQQLCRPGLDGHPGEAQGHPGATHDKEDLHDAAGWLIGASFWSMH